MYIGSESLVQHGGTVLGQLITLPATDVPVPSDRHLLVVLVDLDDFEVGRVAHGDAWAAETLAVAEAVVSRVATSGLASSVIPVPPDAWAIPVWGEEPDSLPDAARELATVLHRHLESACGLEATIGISACYTGARRTELALEGAVAELERKLVEGGSAIYQASPSATGRPETAEPRSVPERVEEGLSRCIRSGDATGAVDTMRRWIDRISMADGVTPALLREWIAAGVLYAVDVAGQRRLADGSADWFAADSRPSLAELLDMFEIHERSNLLLWLEELVPRIVGIQTETSPGRQILTLVEEYIHDHYAEDLRLVTVSDAVYVSPYYVSHLFQRLLGTTFLKYLTTVRLNHGRRLLGETDLPIETVAQHVGYASPKRFRLLFKRTFHVTPSEFRRRHPSDSIASFEAVAV